MKRISSLLVLVSLMSAAACGIDETTTPSSSLTVPAATRQSIGLIPLLTGITGAVTNVVSGQTWLLPLNKAVTVSTQVSATKGGELSVPLLGVFVTIPKGAVDAPTTITMTALPGNVVALDFQPAGTKFKVPLHVVQNMLLTHWLGQSFDVVYFKNTSDINNTKNTVNASETIPVSMLGPIASFDIWHFSGYATAAGRSAIRGGDE